MDPAYSDILNQGYVKIRRKHLWMHKRHWLVLRSASSKGPIRLERFHNQQASNYHCYNKAIDMTSVTAVTRPAQGQRKRTVTVIFSDQHTLVFTCESDKDAEEWSKVLYKECVLKVVKEEEEEEAMKRAAPDLLISSLRHKHSRVA